MAKDGRLSQAHWAVRHNSPDCHGGGAKEFPASAGEARARRQIRQRYEALHC